MAGKPIDFTPDLERFHKAVKQLSDNVPYNGKQVLRNECRLMLEDIVALTKPKSVTRLSDSIKKAAHGAFIPNKREGKLPDKKIYNLYRFKGKTVEPIQRLVNSGAFKAFIKKEREQIGQFAASWLGNNNPLGAKRGVPAYVKRHIGKSEGSIRLVESGLSLKIFVRNFNHLLSALAGMENKMYSLMRRAIKIRTDKTTQVLKNLLKYGGKYKMPKAK